MIHATDLSTMSPRSWRISLPGPAVSIRGRRLSWFHLCGGVGAVSWILALTLGAGLRQLPLAPLLIISATAGGTFVLLAVGTALLLGEARLTWFHHQLAVLATTALVAVAVELPALAYLDLVGTGLLAFGVFGRLGCLLVGCCHGRPARGGVVYGWAHADVGFPIAWVGAPLRPVQLMESAAAAGLTIGCLLILAGPAPAGTALGFSLAGYALVRFWLETWRGDRRPRAAGLSEAQWTATGVATLVVATGVAGAPWVSPMVAALALAVVFSAITRTSWFAEDVAEDYPQ